MRAIGLFVTTILVLWTALTAQAQVADAGPDTSLCVNYYTMQGSPLPPGATGTWAIIAGCGSILDMNDPLTLTVNLCVGTNVFIWTVDDNGQLDTDTLLITVYDAAMANANAGPDTITVIAPQSSAFLSGSPTPIYPATCWWSWVQGNGVIMDPNDPLSLVTGLMIGDNILAWTCDNGPCGTSADTVVIQMMMATGIGSSAVTQSAAIRHDPGQDVLVISAPHSQARLDVLGGNGQYIRSLAAPNGTLSTADLPAGLYIARMIHGDHVQTLRFVVSR
jgi:hypothetical protein